MQIQDSASLHVLCPLPHPSFLFPSFLPSLSLFRHSSGLSVIKIRHTEDIADKDGQSENQMRANVKTFLELACVHSPHMDA